MTRSFIPIRMAASLLLAAALAVPAMAGGIRQLDPAAGVVSQKGFTVKPPAGEGWFVEDGSGSIEFMRMLSRGPGQDRATAEPQTFGVAVVLMRVGADAVNTPERLDAFVKTRMLRADARRRQTLLSATTTPAPASMPGTDCVRYEASFEEQPRRLVLVMTGAGIVCRHPSAPGMLVHGSWSERHARDFDSVRWDAYSQEAQAVLDSIAFTPLD